jgi:hypothetical protein
MYNAFTQIVFRLTCCLLLGLSPVLSFAGIVVVNGLSHEHSMSTGEIEQGVLIIKNNGSTPEAISVYQKDFSFNHNGETFYEEIGTNARSNGNWMVINPLSFVIEPEDEIEVVYEIRVPKDDSLKGTYWSVIMVEPSSELDTSNQKFTVNINSVLRYAVQIITNVNRTSDSLKVDLDFINIEIVKESGKNFLIVDAQNNGDVFLKTEMGVEVFDLNGVSLGVFRSRRGRTYPGTSKRYVVELPDLENGDYQSILVADSENDEVLGVQLVLEISDD